MIAAPGQEFHQGNAIFLPQDMAGITMLGLLEILWIRMNVTERKEGFWYLYWKSSEIQKNN